MVDDQDSATYAQSDLSSAILSGDGELARQIIEAGIDVNKTDSSGSSALHYAAFAGDFETAESLIAKGARVDAKDQNRVSPLHRAAQQDDVELSTLLVSHGASLSSTCRQFQSVFHVCAIHNATAVLSYLLGVNKDVINKTDKSGCSALHHAAYYGHTHVVKLLLNAGADIKAVDNLGRTAIHWAASGATPTNVNVMYMLIGTDTMDVSARDQRGRTALHFAAAAYSRDIAALLLSNTGIAVDSKDLAGFTPLHYAVKHGHRKMVKLLLAAGADMTARADNGFTSIHLAASLTESGGMLDYLIGEVTDVSCLTMSDSTGNTPLHLACRFGKVTRVDALVEAGVDVEEKAEDHVRPVHCSVSAAAVLTKHLLQAGADPNARMRGGATILHLAAQGGQHSIKALVETGCDVNARDEADRTPLMYAAATRDDPDKITYAVGVLIEHGADAHLKDNEGRTALHYAASSGNGQAVNQLLRRNASAVVADNKGRNPLHYAVFHPHNSISIQSLCASNPKCAEGRDSLGLYPIHYAALKGNNGLCSWLLEEMGFVGELPSSGHPWHLSPLHIAAAHNHVHVITDLCRMFKKMKDRTDGDQQATQLSRKTSSVFRSVLTTTDLNRRIPLHYAMKFGMGFTLMYDVENDYCVTGCFETVQLLTSEPGSDRFLTWSDKDDVNPLHLAAAYGQTTILNYVAQTFTTPALFKHPDWRKRTAGMLMLTNGGSDLPLSLESYIDGRLRDANGRGFLHRAVFARRVEVIRAVGRLESTNIRDSLGVTCLHLAAGIGEKDVVQVLLDMGADAALKDVDGMTPADWALAMGQLEVLQELVPPPRCTTKLSKDSAVDTSDAESANSSTATEEHVVVTASGALLGAYGGYQACLAYMAEGCAWLLNCKDGQDRTSLHLAALRAHYETVEWLCERGASVNARDSHGQTALVAAARHPRAVHVLAVTFLRTSQPGGDLFTYESTCSEYLLNHDADPSLKDNNGNNVLHVACENKNEYALQVLLDYLKEHDPDGVICNDANNLKETVLHIATRQGLDEFIFNFIDSSLDSVWAKDADGRYPLMSAAPSFEVAECMHLLLAYMCSGKGLNSSGLTVRDRSSTEMWGRVAPFTIWIEAVTGDRWRQRVFPDETVVDLKRRIARERHIPLGRIALVFVGRALSDALELRSFGVREGSSVKLLVMTRSGPAEAEEEPEVALSDEPSDWEPRTRHRRGLSAPEDTSAKESSCGETERDDADLEGLNGDAPRLHRLYVSGVAARHSRRRTNSSGQQTLTARGGQPSIFIDMIQPDACDEPSPSSSAIHATDRTGRLSSPLDDLMSEEISEASSGMVICDMTNEFRKLKVRRRHATLLGVSGRGRARSKTRGAAVDARDDGTSSDGEDSETVAVVATLPPRRGGARMNVRCGTARCSICSFRVNNPFNCRCGKTLCSRHRSSQAHTCSKGRSRMQQVSD